MKKLVKQLPELKKKQLSTKQRKLPNFLLGEHGEQLARNFLIRRKYIIIESNVRWKNFEIDLIAQDKNADELVFVEVKTRSTDSFGQPSLAVNYKKVFSMKKTADAWIRKHNLNKNYRFDIITIIKNKSRNSKPEILHIKNFTLDF